MNGHNRAITISLQIEHLYCVFVLPHPVMYRRVDADGPNETYIAQPAAQPNRKHEKRSLNTRSWVSIVALSLTSARITVNLNGMSVVDVERSCVKIGWMDWRCRRFWVCTKFGCVTWTDPSKMALKPERLLPDALLSVIAERWTSPLTLCFGFTFLMRSEEQEATVKSYQIHITHSTQYSTQTLKSMSEQCRFEDWA